jgi:succinyl-CoA synthetase alpha subunit
MAIFLTDSSKILVQGITGSEGTKHTRRMVASGTNIVGGVNPRKAGQDVDGIPVFATVADTVKETGADVSVIFVPPKFTKDAVIEAVDAGVPLVVVITEGVPVHDTGGLLPLRGEQRHQPHRRPELPGLISPGKSNAGIIPPTSPRPAASAWSARAGR